MYFTHESHHGGIIDLRNPAQPEVYDNAWLDSATHIAGYDTDYLYVATGYDPEPVIVLDIHSDPVNPQSVGYYPTFVNSAIRNDDRLYACDDYSFQILSLFGHFAADKSQAPFISSFTLHSAYPNPFNGVTTIRFELPRSVPVVYDVFNALGQQVTSRDLGVLNGGEQRVSLDANGWGSGSYWVRLQAGADVLGTKIVLLK
jgi:hypothetical protein